MSRLTSSYRAAALEHFSQLAKEVEDNASLAQSEKLATLLEVIYSVSEIIDRLSRSAPEVAPELFENRRDKTENSYDFFRRVYRDYIQRGISAPDILALNPKLYHAIKDRRRKQKDYSLTLPSRSEASDALLAQLGDDPSLASIIDRIPTVFRRYVRLYDTVSARRHRAGHPTPK